MVIRRAGEVKTRSAGLSVLVWMVWMTWIWNTVFILTLNLTFPVFNEMLEVLVMGGSLSVQEHIQRDNKS